MSSHCQLVMPCDDYYHAVLPLMNTPFLTPFAAPRLNFMAQKPLDVLKTGLELLQNRYKARREEIQGRLAEKKSVSSQDEKWLDGVAYTAVLLSRNT